MSVYNTITSLAESPLQAGLIYAGTDDGLIQITDSGGASWTRIEVGSIPGMPATAFVNNLVADLHDVDVVYAALDNHKFGDLNPYLVKSTDRGRTWQSIVGNLPERTLVWRLVQDHANPSLLFVATEFGIYFTVDGGKEWTKVSADATIAFRDITIQRRENDLVAASFGRGFFILDDYAPLRAITPELLQSEAHLFPARDAYLYVPRNVAGGSQGTEYFSAPNPEYGATFTYYLRDAASTMEQERKEREKAVGEEDIPFPGWEVLEEERNEVADRVTVVVHDAAGDVAGRVTGGSTKGLHRVTWNLRYPYKGLIMPGGNASGMNGFLATPGTYTAMLTRVSDGVETELSDPITFSVVPLYEPALAGASPEVVASFRKEMEALQGQMALFSHRLTTQKNLVTAMQTAAARSDRSSADFIANLHAARDTLLAFEVRVRGFGARGEVGERNPPSALSRIYVGMQGLSTTYGPTDLHRATVRIGTDELAILDADLTDFIERVMPDLEAALRALGGPPIGGQ